ncbi:MAG: hypothetical protein HZB38_07625, partial [Planctomycetes bacterium]|nr:hypothetical protein [Planctomycetota bacterium]
MSQLRSIAIRNQIVPTRRRFPCIGRRWAVCVLVSVLAPAIVVASVIPPDDMFFAPLSLTPAVYPVKGFTGDGTATPWTATWTTGDVLSRDSGRSDIVLTGVQILPVLVPNPSPESEQGEYTAAELGSITVGNYMTYYAQKPGVDLLDPATDYVGDLTGNVITVQFA